MKEINELQLPDDVRYTEDHEWARVEGQKTKAGICDYAQDQLGDIVYVELPQVGDTFDKGQEFGTVESVKAVAELYMPVGGTILAVNSALEQSPELVNKDPYGEGWMIEVQPSDPAEFEALRYGLIEKVVPDDDLMDAAMELAETIMKKGPLAVVAAKKVLNRTRDLPLAAGLALESDLWSGLTATEDMKEGARAFIEKRRPEYKCK